MKNKIILGIAGALLAVASWFVGQVTPTNLGSVASTEVYRATTTDSTDANKSYLACKGACMLGSIIVTQPGTAGYVRIWDATSTATSTLVETFPFSSTTYAVAVGRPVAQVLGSSDVAGTYTFDFETTYGVVIETSTGFDGQYQVTVKQ